MLEEGLLTQTYPERSQRLTEGVFWFFIAAALLLALLEADLPVQVPLPLPVAWAGVFVLYHALRTAFTRLSSRPSFRGGQPENRSRQWWSDALWLPLLCDLVVITGLVALSGGWASPLYLLYLGWSVALLDAPSTLIGLCFSGLAASAFVLSALLAPHAPFSALQMTLLTEHALLLLSVGLGISGVGVYLKHLKSTWEAERQRWDTLRKRVFSQLSHELYTPLSAISASAVLAAEEECMPERHQHLLGVIERNCAHMNLLIDDLLTLWKEPQRALNASPSRIGSLSVAQSVGQMLAPLLEGKQQRLVMQVEPEDVCVLADQHQLEQVLMNLLVNAQKYAPAGTAITLTICGQEYDVLFGVHDEGPGVPLNEQGQLFEMFYRGANSLASSRGSGIGLALAKALVVLQGGRVWVESVPGKGSTFYFTLPAADSK